MKRSMLAMIAVVCLGLLGAAAAWAGDEILTVAQDQVSMVQTIERYLKANHNLSMEEKTAGDKTWVDIPFKGDPMPDFHFSVHAQLLGTDDDGKATERAVRVEGLTGVFVPESKRSAVLKAINDFNHDKIFSAVYLDEDGEIMMDWSLAVLPEGLPTAYVYDTLAWENRLWRELYPLVSPLL